MKTRVYTGPESLEHHPPQGHPEHAGRLRAVMAGATGAGVEIVDAHARADRAALERVHHRAHVDAVFAAAPSEGEACLDADTWMSAGSLAAALAAAGAGMAAVDAVLDGECEAAFVAARPPGHHAEPDRAMGFCLFNTVAIAAMHALDARGLSSAAIVDIDVHHGNGTQAFAEGESRLTFASIHQGWIYPGTGAAHETGVHGNIINLPMPAGTQGGAWLEAIRTRILPRLEREQPEILLVSAGFDAHAADPLAGLCLEDADYAAVGALLAQAAQSWSASRLVCVLEGGYDCPALERSARAFLGALSDT
jgi:acetoin utilization deacetylase AcuC-like enzyme